MHRRALVPSLALLPWALVGLGLGPGTALAQAGPGGSTVVASYAADRAPADPDPITGIDAGYGVVAWSNFVRKQHVSYSQVHVRLPSGTVKTLGYGSVVSVVRVNGPGGTPGVRVIVETCQKVACDRAAIDPFTGYSLDAAQPWIDQLIGDGGSATDGASTVQDGEAITVQPATPGTATCGVTAFTLDDTQRLGSVPSITECTAPAWVQMRGPFIVARTSMPSLSPRHYRWQSVVLDTSAPVPTWTRIATATQNPGGGTFIKREAIGASSITLLQEPFRGFTKAGVVIDAAPRALFQTTIPAPSPYAPAIAATPTRLSFPTTLRSPLIAVRSDGTDLFVLRARRSAGARQPKAFEILRLPAGLGQPA